MKRLMFKVRVTPQFHHCVDALQHARAQVRIAVRLRLAEAGKLGDWKTVGSGV